MFDTLCIVCSSDFLIEYSDVCNSFCYSNRPFVVYWLDYLDNSCIKNNFSLDKRNKTLYNSPVVMVTTKKTKHKLNTLLNYE